MCAQCKNKSIKVEDKENMPKVNRHRRAPAYLRTTLPLLDPLCHHCHLILDKNNFLHTLISTSLHTHREPFVLKWQHFASQPPWMMTNIFVSPRLCQISPLKTPAWSLHLTRSSSATGAAADSVGRAEKIRFICVNSLCVGSLICLFVW